MKILVALLALSGSTAVLAEPITVRRVLKDTTTVIAVDLTEQTVFCTDRGYGNVQLKVSVPDLDWLAHFNHRVAGEGLPCITGGACDENRNPGSILDPKEKVAVIPVRVILSEVLVMDAEKQTCVRSLEEQVKSQIRGHDFVHVRGSAKTENVEFEKCVKVQNQ